MANFTDEQKKLLNLDLPEYSRLTGWAAREAATFLRNEWVVSIRDTPISILTKDVDRVCLSLMRWKEEVLSEMEKP